MAPLVWTTASWEGVLVDLEGILRTSLAGRYHIEEEIGRGGMSVVYRAHDLKHNRPVAIKVLRPELSEQIGGERFQREIEVVAGLNHPHILPLHDSGDADGLLYYVMPLLEGGSLRHRIESEGALPEKDALRIAGEIAGALAHAHAHQVIHRDVKPGNILLSGDHALLADFGIAHLAGDVLETLTGEGIALGTPAYLSPEQASGATDIDERSDIYSLGCVLYEALTGSPPFSGDSVRAMLLHQIVDTPTPARTLNRNLSIAAAAIVAKSMEKDPGRRFQSGAEMAEALSLARPRIASRLGYAVARLRSYFWSTRPMRATTVVAMLILGFAIGLGLQSWYERTSSDPLRASLRYLVLEFAPQDATDEESALSRRAARLLRDHLEGWNSVSVIPELAMGGPSGNLLAAGIPQSSFAMGNSLAQQFNVDYVVRVHARPADAPQTLSNSGESGPVDVSVVVQPPGSSAIFQSFDTTGPTDSLRNMMAGVAMEMLDLRLEGEARNFGDLMDRSPDHYALREFDEGRDALRRWRLAEAHRLFESAITRDSSFALAHFLLAQTMYWEIFDAPVRRYELGPRIEFHASRAEEEGGDRRLRPGEAREVAAFHSFWRGDYDGARARYDSLIRFEPADIESLVLRGAVEIEDPMLEERPDGSLHPRQSLNVARMMFDTATALAPGFELSWGQVHLIDRQLAEAAYRDVGLGFEPPGVGLVTPYAERETGNLGFFCPAIEADSIVWRERNSAGCAIEESERDAAASIQARTVARLDALAKIKLDQPRHHEDLAGFLLWQRSRSGCAVDPFEADSLVRIARQHVERALEIRGDTTPQDLLRLASLYLASGEHDEALLAAERGLGELGNWESLGGTPPPTAAANPFLLAGRADYAASIIEHSLTPSSARIQDPQRPDRWLQTNGMYPTLNALLALGTAGAGGEPAIRLFNRIQRAWRDVPETARDRAALRRAALDWAGPALFHVPEAWDWWFEGWDQHDLELPPIWKAIQATFDDPPDSTGARTELLEAADRLKEDSSRDVYPQDFYLPIVLARQLQETDVEQELRNGFSRCPLDVDHFDPGWGMRHSLGQPD